MKSTRYTILILLGVGALLIAPAPRAQAFLDPVTIAILAPIALKVADAAKPYVIRGLVSGGKQLIAMGADVLGVLRLPLGFVQTTFLGPFGGFRPGLVNLMKGAIAPFKLCWDTLLFPIALCGVQINN